MTHWVAAYGYLACFGDEARSVVGFYPEIPDDAGLGGACAGVPSGMEWITCNLGYEQIVGDAAAGFFGPGLPPRDRSGNDRDACAWPVDRGLRTIRPPGCAGVHLGQPARG